MNEENEKHVETTVVTHGRWVRNHMSTFLSIVNKDLPVKNIVFTTSSNCFRKGTDFDV